MTLLWCSSKFAQLYKLSLCNWRASEASETLLVVVQWKTRYVYTYIYIYVRHVYMWYVRHTFVARSWSDVMWEELSVSHF